MKKSQIWGRKKYLQGQEEAKRYYGNIIFLQVSVPFWELSCAKFALIKKL